MQCFFVWNCGVQAVILLVILQGCKMLPPIFRGTHKLQVLKEESFRTKLGPFRNKWYKTRRWFQELYSGEVPWCIVHLSNPKDPEIHRGTMGWARNYNSVCKDCTENSVRGFLWMSAVFRSRSRRNTRTSITLSCVYGKSVCGCKCFRFECSAEI